MPAAERLLRCLARVTPTERGAYRLARALNIRPGPRDFTLPGGLTMTLNPGVYPDLLMAFGLYERSLLRLLRKAVRPGDVVVDGGANVGYVTLHAAKRGAVVHAFEPHAGNRARLIHHVERNGLTPRVHVHPQALADRAMTVRMCDGGENHGQATIFGDDRGDSAQAVALDAWLPELKPRLVKLDIEGAELLALRGMAGIIGRARPLVVGEFNPVQSRAAGVDPWAWVELLIGQGYRAYRIGAWLHPVRSASGLGQCNLLMKPRA